MRYTTFFALIAMLAVPGTAIAADCQPAFIDRDPFVTINGSKIEPGGQSTEDLQLRIRNTAGEADSSPGMSAPVNIAFCQTTLRISQIAASLNPDFPYYSLQAFGNQRVEILPDPASGGTANSDIIINNVLSDAQGQTVPIQISVPTEWGIKGGTFTEQLQLSLIGETGSIVDRTTLTTTIVIPSAVSMRLVGAVVGDGSAGPARIDLGNLSSSSETRSDNFSALILSTTPYTVELNSNNQGNLLHDQGREKIPYRLYFDEQEVNLDGAFEIPYPTSTPQSGDRRPMSIVVPPVVALAGRYSDRITMTVTAM